MLRLKRLNKSVFQETCIGYAISYCDCHKDMCNNYVSIERNTYFLLTVFQVTFEKNTI